MKKKMLVSLMLVMATQVTLAKEAKSPTPEQCLKSFAKNYVPEYNMANEFIISKDKKDIQGAKDVINSTSFPDWMKKFADSSLRFSDAVGVVFNYGDEVHMIFTSVDVVNDKCQVKEIADINTVDISASKDQTLLAKYFLGKEKSTLPEPVRKWLYDEVATSLKGE